MKIRSAAHRRRIITDMNPYLKVPSVNSEGGAIIFPEDFIKDLEKVAGDILEEATQFEKYPEDLELYYYNIKHDTKYQTPAGFTPNSDIIQNIDNKLDELSQIWQDGYNSHLMFYHASRHWHEMVDPKFKELTHYEMLIHEEQSILMLGKLFDKDKNNVSINNLLFYIKKHPSQFEFGSTQELETNVDRDLDLIKLNSNKRLADVIDRVRKARHNLVAHLSGNSSSRDEKLNLTISEVNDLYCFTHYIIHKYSALLNKLQLEKNYDIVNAYKESIKDRLSFKNNVEAIIFDTKEKADNLIKRLAMRGIPEYAFQLAITYEHQHNDLLKSLSWHIVASKLGSRLASTAKRNLLSILTKNEIELAEKESIEIIKGIKLKNQQD